MGCGREGLGGVGDRPAARNGDVRRSTSYNETCMQLRQENCPLSHRRPADDVRRLLIYVFFLPKLNDGLGSELGSGEIWNAEKA